MVKLLGGWDGQALVAMPIYQSMSKGRQSGNIQGWSLSLIDLGDGHTKEVFKQLASHLPIVQSIMVDGEAFVFASTGAAIRVDCVANQATILSEDFWKDAGIKICKDPGAMPNPRVFGRPFLDSDGNILLPSEPKVAIDELDIQRAWSKLDESRRRELIQQGDWPAAPGKVLGWKGQAGFLRFAPTSKKWDLVESAKFAELVEMKDRKFICMEFKSGIEHTTLFAVEKGSIILMKAPDALADAQPKPVAPRPVK